MTTNIFPARVAILPGATYPKARVRTNSTESRIQVWINETAFPHRPVCVVDAPIVSTETAYNQWAPMRDRHARWLVTMGAPGEDIAYVIEASALGGCGCGDPLRSLPAWSKTTQQSMAGV